MYVNVSIIEACFMVKVFLGTLSLDKFIDYIQNVVLLTDLQEKFVFSVVCSATGLCYHINELGRG